VLNYTFVISVCDRPPVPISDRLGTDPGMLPGVIALLTLLVGIGGVNDSPAQADLLARRLRGFSPAAHVNLIPLNPTPGFGAPASPPRRVFGFAERLRAGGLSATIRKNRGTAIDAACGQLRTRHAAERTAPVTMGPRRGGT